MNTTTNTNILLADDTNNTNNIESVIAEGLLSGKSLLGKDGILTPFVKKALEQMLEAEMDEFLIENKITPNAKPNKRNGKNTKIMSSEIGKFELNTPRDRNGEFMPKIVEKRQTVLGESLDRKILSLFQTGMGYEDISNQIKELYDYDISDSTISNITDRLLPIITDWRNRPLDAVYPILFLDAIFLKVRENGYVQTKVVYNLLGINLEGKKDVLGFYSSDSEGASFWLSVLNDLKTRGVCDILIACIDGLKGFPEAIESVFPKTTIQLCIVHQIRNSLKYIGSKHQKEFANDLKAVYKASNKELAESSLAALKTKYSNKYPIVLSSWENNWHLLSNFFQFSPHIRKLIYTTNSIESLHRNIRKYTKTKGAFTSKNAMYKVLYCAIMNAQKKWTSSLPNWAETLSQLNVAFPNRIKLPLFVDAINL